MPAKPSRRPRRPARSPPTSWNGPRRNSRRSRTSTSSTSMRRSGVKSRSCSRYERRRHGSTNDRKAIGMSDDIWKPGDKNPRRPGPVESEMDAFDEEEFGGPLFGETSEQPVTSFDDEL